MNMKAIAQVITKTAEAMFSRCTKEEFLYFSLDIQYVCPFGDEQKNVSVKKFKELFGVYFFLLGCGEELTGNMRLEKRFGMHFILRRAGEHVILLRCTKGDAYFICDGDLFYLISSEDSSWKESLKFDLDVIHTSTLKRLDSAYKKVLNREMTQVEKSLQPSMIWLQNFKVLKGNIVGAPNLNSYRAKIESGETNFVRS